MDRLHRKKRSFGQDNLEYWYLTPTVSSKDVIAAWKFIHTKDEESALQNVNVEMVKVGNAEKKKNDYKLTKQNDDYVIWNAETGFTLGKKTDGGLKKAGLNNTDLKNAKIRSAIIRVDIPALKTTGVSPRPAYTQFLTQPNSSFGLIRGYTTFPYGQMSVNVHDEYALLSSLPDWSTSAEQSYGGTGYVFWQLNEFRNVSMKAGEFVFISGYGKISSNESKYNFSGCLVGETGSSIYTEVHTKYDNIQYGHYTPKERHTFMSSNVYWLNIKAAAFYNRLLTEQEHKDLIRMIQKL